MNLLLYILTFLFSVFSVPVDDDCTCKGIKLYGKVENVDHFWDLKVEVVDNFPDLNIEIVSAYADECGEWEIVDNFGDFKVEFVDSYGDIKVTFINSGYPDGYHGMK